MTTFRASNGYTVEASEPWTIKVLDRGGDEKYRVGKYTTEALREYFADQFGVKPTVREQIDKLAPLTRFVVPGSGTATFTKMATPGFILTESPTTEPRFYQMDRDASVWSTRTDTITVVD